MGYMDEFDVLIGIAAIERGLNQLGEKVNIGAGVSAAEKILFTK